MNHGKLAIASLAGIIPMAVITAIMIFAMHMTGDVVIWIALGVGLASSIPTCFFVMGEE